MTAAGKPEPPSRSVRVLLIDDDEEDYLITRDLVSEIENSQIGVEWVSSYELGLEALRKNRHDLYLIDYRLGSRNGLDFIREANRIGCAAPVILLTGQGDRDVDLEAMKAGAADYLVKGQLSAPLLERSIRYSLDRAQTLRELRHSEERFRILIEKGHDVITTLNADAILVYASPSVERVFGYRPDELIGQSVLGFIHPDDIVSVLGFLSVCEEQPGLTPAVQYRFRHRSGAWRFVESAANNLLQDPVVASVVISTRDVTSRKILQDQLVQSEKLAALGQLVAGVAHELNNPLTSVLGYAQLLLTDSSLSSRQREQLELVNREADRTRRIVNNLLSFARQKKSGRSLINLNMLIERTLELRAYEMRVHNVQVRHFFGEIPDIVGDEHQIQQVLLNIIMNAEEAIRKQETRKALSVYTMSREEPAGRWVVVKINDTGPGIAPENLPRIFDPFFTTKLIGEGTGLGLSISYGIINEHGGRITAESEPGEGTTFIIELPETRD